MSPKVALCIVKIVHTVVWAFFVGCILAIPFYAWHGRFAPAAAFAAVVCVEVLILAANKWSCPLTGIAARYTEQRQANFDIYLPLWVARYNKHLFGSLFVLGVLYTVARWLGWM